jgi:hypothetical protein
MAGSSGCVNETIGVNVGKQIKVIEGPLWFARSPLDGKLASGQRWHICCTYKKEHEPARAGTEALEDTAHAGREATRRHDVAPIGTDNPCHGVEQGAALRPQVRGRGDSRS